MSSPDHLFSETPAPITPEVAVAPADPINPGAENPPWTGLDLLLIAFTFLVALFFASMVIFAVALRSPRFAGISATDLAKNPDPWVIVPTMTVAYVAMLAAMYILVARHRLGPFWRTVGWHWPSPQWWLGCIVLGGVLAVGLGQLSRLLPTPKTIPMDRLFRHASGAYLMAFFGLAVAPLAEEMLFRGFLYPVFDRWLQTLFMVRQRIRFCSGWALTLAAWGYLEYRLPLLWSVLLALLMFLATLAIFLTQSLKAGRPKSHPILWLGASLFVWGLVSRSFADRSAAIAALVFVGLGVLLGLLGVSRPLGAQPAGRLGRLLAVFATGAGFAVVHSEQLGRAWGPLLVLFVVGLILTVTRAVTRSVAPGFLIHVGYNLTLFILLYAGTDRFRHLERMTQ